MNIDPIPAQRGSAWTFLNWTNKEVSSIQSIAKAAGLAPDTRTGNAATEEAFKQIGREKPSPRSIHLATHGYFFPDPSPLKGGGRGITPLLDRGRFSNI
ncbi:MAG: CHAT domain-containing protein [Saprospiraceae bacterium]|nr:CHAT domain-containing protein [Saprospiraceae bacterium]